MLKYYCRLYCCSQFFTLPELILLQHDFVVGYLTCFGQWNVSGNDSSELPLFLLLFSEKYVLANPWSKEDDRKGSKAVLSFTLELNPSELSLY